MDTWKASHSTEKPERDCRTTILLRPLTIRQRGGHAGRAKPRTFIMKIISFSFISEALLSGNKTVTRRDWDEDYAKRFKKGDLVQAYNRSQRHGGKRIAIIRLTQDAYLEPWCEIPDTDFEKEGFEYLALHTKYHGFWMDKNAPPEKRLEDIQAYYKMCQKMDRHEWVIRFEVVEFIKEKPIGAQLELF